jgi:hypothetical protein
MKSIGLVSCLLLLSCWHSSAKETEPTPPTDPPPDIHVDTPKKFDPSVLGSVLAYATSDNDTYVKDLFDLVSIPSISALPDHAKDVLAAAGWLKLRMVTAGLENVQVLNTEGPQPVVRLGWWWWWWWWWWCVCGGGGDVGTNAH